MAQEIALHDLSHREARSLLASGAPVFLPVNPWEYHGPHLSLANDGLVAQGLARDLHARLGEDQKDWPFVVARELTVGCDVTPGPGAVDTPYPVVRRLVVDACQSLERLGARRVVVVSFHGGPNHNNALDAGVRYLEKRGIQALAPLSVLLGEMLVARGEDHPDAVAHVKDAATRAELLRGLPMDFHAGFFETSLSLHYAPQTVSEVRATLPPCPAIRPATGLALAARVARALGAEVLGRELALAAHGQGWHALRPFPGYTSHPAHASAASGAYFAKTIVDRYLACARDVFSGRARAPRPILRWLPSVTLGGRLGRVRIPDGSVAT